MPSIQLPTSRDDLLAAIDAELQKRGDEDSVERARINAEATRARCSTLVGFVREAWHVLHPDTPYVHGWHINAICAHLEAVSRGLIKRLLINVPPGTGKSLLVSVAWPAWEWTRNPSLQYLTTSYSADYVKRDSRRMRDLVTSDWYQSLWGNKFHLLRAGEVSFENSERGFREGKAFGSLTGGRGDRVIIDDPHSTETAESDTERASATRIFRESVPTRLNSPGGSAIVIIMQRLHEQDVSGQALSLNLGYQHLMLPMEFEPDRKCRTSFDDGSPFFEDPRKVAGELLFPERFSREVIERDKVPLGSYAVAGQFQQRPSPREGGMFKRHWFEIVPAAPATAQRVRGWDLAGTKGTSSAFTAGVKLSAHNGIYYIEDVRRERGSPADVERLILSTAISDTRSCRISVPQDPGQAGVAQKFAYAKLLTGFDCRFTPETGSKESRAIPVSAQAEAGNVKLVAGTWNTTFLDEVCLFPAGQYKDQTDALSRAFAALISDTSTFTLAYVR